MSVHAHTASGSADTLIALLQTLVGRRGAARRGAAAGISDRYSAKSAGRRGEHGYTYISTVGPSQDADCRPSLSLSPYALADTPHHPFNIKQIRRMHSTNLHVI